MLRNLRVLNSFVCIQETRKLVDTVLLIQPRVSGGGGGRSIDDIVGELADEIFQSLGDPLDRENAKEGLFHRTETGQLNSLSVVLGQEIDRFNRCAHPATLPAELGMDALA